MIDFNGNMDPVLTSVCLYLNDLLHFSLRELVLDTRVIMLGLNWLPILG